MHASRHAEHEAHEHERPSRHVRKDERFGLPRLEVTVVVAVAAMLGVEVQARRVASPAQTSRVETGRGRRARIPPPSGDSLDLSPEARRGCSLRTIGERHGGVLEKTILRPSERLGRQSPRFAFCLDGAERRRGSGRDGEAGKERCDAHICTVCLPY